MLGEQQAARDQDPVIVVVRSAQTMLREGLGESDSAAFEKQFAEAYEKSEWASVIDLLLGNAQVVFKKVSAADDVDKVSKTAEGYFEVTLSLLSKLETVEDVVSKINAFIDTMKGVSADSSSVQALKLKLLTTLFATLNPKAQLRLMIAKGLCKFAGSDLPKLAGPVFALVKDCERWISDFDWEMTEEEKSEIYGLVASVAPPSDKLNYLRLQASVASVSQRPQLNQQLAIETIRESSALVITRASFDGADKTTAECLEILSSGSFAGMELFVNSNGEFLSVNGIDKSALLEKMRVLALSRLAAGKSTVSISQIGESLKTPNPVDVIVKTIREGLIMGSIDEVEGVVRIVAVKHATNKDSVEKDLKKVSARLEGL